MASKADEKDDMGFEIVDEKTEDAEEKKEDEEEDPYAFFPAEKYLRMAAEQKALQDPDRVREQLFTWCYKPLPVEDDDDSTSPVVEKQPDFNSVIVIEHDKEVPDGTQINFN